MGVCLGLEQEQTRMAARWTARAALTLHYCDEVFANGARKSHRPREHPRTDLRTSHLSSPTVLNSKFDHSERSGACLASAFTGCKPIGYARASSSRGGGL
jgi:hypothetical protein